MANQSTIPNFYTKSLTLIESRDYYSDTVRGTFNENGDFLPAHSKPSAIITGKKTIINASRNFTDDNTIFTPPSYVFISELSQNSTDKVSDMRGGQVKRGDINW